MSEDAGRAGGGRKSWPEHVEERLLFLAGPGHGFFKASAQRGWLATDAQASLVKTCKLSPLGCRRNQ